MQSANIYSNRSLRPDFYNTNTPRHHFGKIVTDILLGLLYSSVLTYSGLGLLMIIFSIRNQEKPDAYDSRTNRLALLGGTVSTAYYTTTLQLIRFISASPRSVWLEERSMTAKEAAHIFIAVVIGIGLNTGLYNGSVGDVSYPYYKDSQAKAPDTLFLYQYVAGIALLYLLIHKPLIWFDYISDTGEWLFQTTPETKVIKTHNQIVWERNWEILPDWETQTESMIYYGTPGNTQQPPIQNTPAAISPNRYRNRNYDLPLAKSPCRRFMDNNPRSFMTKVLKAMNQRWNEMPSVEDAQNLILTALEQTPLKDTASRRKKLLRHRAGHSSNPEQNTLNSTITRQTLTSRQLHNTNGGASSTTGNNPMMGIAFSDEQSVISSFPDSVRLSQNLHALFSQLCPACRGLIDRYKNSFEATASSTESNPRGLSDDSSDGKRQVVTNV